MLDATISDSYLRGVSWSADVPAANEEARHRRFDVIMARSFLRDTVECEHATVELGLTVEEDHVFCMTRLVKAGQDEFGEPAQQTARFIHAMRDKPDVVEMWSCCWMGVHVMAPLFDAVLAGLVKE